MLIYPLGAGYHYFFGPPLFSRHAWYITHYVRPYDVPALVAALDRTLAFVAVYAKGPSDAVQFVDDPAIFPPDAAMAVRPRLGVPVAVGPRCWVVPIGEPPK